MKLLISDIFIVDRLLAGCDKTGRPIVQGMSKNGFGQINFHIYLTAGIVDFIIFCETRNSGHFPNVFINVDLEMSCSVDNISYHTLT